MSRTAGILITGAGAIIILSLSFKPRSEAQAPGTVTLPLPPPPTTAPPPAAVPTPNTQTPASPPNVRTPTAPPPPAFPPDHEIFVDRYHQRLYAFDGPKLVYSAACSTAAHYKHWAPGEKKYLQPSTPLGHYTIHEKSPDHWSKPYEVHMRWALFFDGGRAIHATFPSLYGMLGRPASGGCVRLTRSTAQALYHWARIGDAVNVVTTVPEPYRSQLPALPPAPRSSFSHHARHRVFYRRKRSPAHSAMTSRHTSTTPSRPPAPALTPPAGTAVKPSH